MNAYQYFFRMAKESLLIYALPFNYSYRATGSSQIHTGSVRCRYSDQTEAAYALGGIGGSKAKKALEKALEKETSEDMRKAISSALTDIAYSNLRED